MKTRTNPLCVWPLILPICCLLPSLAIGQTDGLKTHEKQKIARILAPVEVIINRKRQITAQKMAKYAEHLVDLEKAVATSGDLDAAMKVRIERESYEKGTITAGFEAGAKAALIKVAAARSILDNQLQTLDGQASRALERDKVKAVKALNQIKVEITKSGRLEAAMEVNRKIEEVKSWTIATTGIPDRAQPGNVLTVASQEEPFVNSLGMKFVPVPITGGPTDGKMILFSVWETRMKDFEAFMKHDRKHNWPGSDSSIDDDHPASHVSWDEAAAFCEWLTATEIRKRKIEPNQRYRLPSDHEWSCAVGIGKLENPDLVPKAKAGKLRDVYPWGSDFPPPAGSGNYYGIETEKTLHLNRKPIEGWEDPFARTAPVGSFEPNEFGLFDLSGNLWEWCEGWSSGEKKLRVRRGGSWFYESRNDLLSSGRNTRLSDAHVVTGGFRCVLE